MPGSEAPAGTVIAHHADKPRLNVGITREIPLALILEPLDPMRHSMDDEAMLDLQRSIRESGLFENLCVVPVLPEGADAWVRVLMPNYDTHIQSGGRFRVAAGHRRLLACRAVGYNPVKCEIFVDLSVNEETIMHGENTHREDPSDFDLAVLYSKWSLEPEMTERELSKRAGKSLIFIYARIELLQGYKEVADALHERKISFAVARALNRCDEPEYAQHFLNMAVDNGLTAKYVGAMVTERKAHKDMAQPAPPSGPQPLHISAPAFQRIECLLCGDSQSYNLQTVMLCGPDVERIKAARAAAEQAEETKLAAEGGKP
jgi:ParB/RepB/Spo0J family partition protein